MEVATVTEELGAVRLIVDWEWVSAEQVEELREDVTRAVGDARGHDGRWTEEALAVEAGEDCRWGRKEGTEAEGEEVGGIARTGEDIARDSEVAIADLDGDFRFEQLGDEAGDFLLLERPAEVGGWVGGCTAIELGVRKDLHKGFAIFGLDMVSCGCQLPASLYRDGGTHLEDAGRCP